MTKTDSSPTGQPEELPRRLTSLPQSVKKALEPLTRLERRFVELYCGKAHGNQTLAVMLISDRVKSSASRKKSRKKKPAPNGAKRPLGGRPVSYSTAASMGSQLLMRPHVRVAVAAWMDAFAMSAAEVTYRIGDLAQAEMGPFVTFDARGNPKLKSDPETFRMYQHWIKGVKTNGKGQIIALDIHSRFEALKEMEKILKLGSDRPILELNLYYQQMDNDTLLRELQEAYAEVARQRHDDNSQLQLPAGGPVAVK